MKGIISLDIFASFGCTSVEMMVIRTLTGIKPEFSFNTLYL